MAMMSYEPGDDLCPPWWPGPWPGPRRWWEEHGLDQAIIPADARVTLGMFRALTLYNMAFQMDDADAAGALKQTALRQLEGQMEKLGRMAKG